MAGSAGEKKFADFNEVTRGTLTKIDGLLGASTARTNISTPRSGRQPSSINLCSR